MVILDRVRNLQILIDDDIIRCHYASGLLNCPILEFTLSVAEWAVFGFLDEFYLVVSEPYDNCLIGALPL